MEFFITSTLHSLVWRWQHITQPTLWALWFYLFPVAGVHWQRRGWLLCLIILVGYGNIKYLLMVLFFLFPMKAA